MCSDVEISCVQDYISMVKAGTLKTFLMDEDGKRKLKDKIKWAEISKHSSD